MQFDKIPLVSPEIVDCVNWHSNHSLSNLFHCHTCIDLNKIRYLAIARLLAIGLCALLIAAKNKLFIEGNAKTFQDRDVEGLTAAKMQKD